MSETITEEEKEFVIDHGNGARSTVKGRVITTDHGVTDEEGNPKVSVHIHMDKSQVPFPATGTVEGV